MGDYQLEQRTNLPSTTQHNLPHASHYRGVQATLNIKASHTFEEVALEIEQENILVKIFSLLDIVMGQIHRCGGEGWVSW